MQNVNKNLVIFGTGEIAELASYYFKIHDLANRKNRISTLSDNK